MYYYYIIAVSSRVPAANYVRYSVHNIIHDILYAPQYVQNVTSVPRYVGTFVYLFIMYKCFAATVA